MSTQIITGCMPTQEDIEYILEQERLERQIIEIVDAKIQKMWNELTYYLDHRYYQQNDGGYDD